MIFPNYSNIGVFYIWSVLIGNRMSSSLGPFVRPAILGLVLHAHKIPPLEYLVVVRSASGALVLFKRRSGLSLRVSSKE